MRTDHPSGALAVLFSVTVLRLLGLHDTGRSGVTTTCRRRMTVWGRPHDVSAHLLDSAIHNHYRNKVRHDKLSYFLQPCSQRHMTRAHDPYDERACGRRSDLSNLHAVVLGRVGASPLLQYIILFSHGYELTGDRTRLSTVFIFLGVSRLPKFPIRDRFALVEGYHVGYSSDARVAPKLMSVVPRVALTWRLV